jgi:hypothetical protein
MRTSLYLVVTIAWLITPAAAQPQTPASQTVTMGPWTIATTYKADKFDNCTMSRSVGELGVAFVRVHDGLRLVLDSSKWNLDRGKAYSVRLVAGSQSVDAKALAETKSVTVALADASFNTRLRSSNRLQVRGEGDTLEVPLDGSMAALQRLDACFEKNSRDSAETNPFVPRSRTP